MKNQFWLRPCFAALSAGAVLSLLACTETKTKDIPAPIPTTPVTNEEAREYGQYTELKWSDEFDAAVLDPSKWVYEQGGGGWGNNELQTYTSSDNNAYLRDGKLVIQAVQSGSSYTSARLITKGKQSFQYGRLDIRAKIPKGKGVWPAIWMLGADIDQNNWPKCGEIDIMELRGSRPTELLSTMHLANNAGAHEYRGTTEKMTVDLSADYHTYSVVRSKNMTRFYFDGSATPYYTYTATDGSPFPFNNPFFMILNVAVGGNFDGNPDGTATFPQQMLVDYVRYYQYK
ncbi:glycoside hydrolase family 16 protein [Hymenobacter sp. HSC-4F20]|uniref:glycoside hydrolase family 16 protein n=1 Tax=Hymenobacter sp. HSC-4F20 TaxID=2864135 RepID=UPI001C72A606|nr:glycoside hydrolase family 16 protein [Hymenobacter sp. HSC-4F20]MBX0291839.1 glycoside hydrolase family 16 protein [Hymenobacter sp. HSC-4F20]